jgi:hypothetical protein
MDPRVVGLFAQHGNLLTRRQALARGLSRHQVDGWVRSGAWVPVRRSVYALADFWEGLDERRGRPLHLARAASVAMTTPHVMSHDSAALELGMELLARPPLLVHVTRPGALGCRSEHGVKHHRAPYAPDQVVLVDGRPVLDLARTAADIAREHGVLHGVVAFDHALRSGATRDDLARVIAQMRSWPHVTRVREASDLADGGAANLAESLGRMLVTELGVGRPQTQFGLTDGTREVWCDLRIGRHVVEIDGAVKLRPVGQGGFAEHPERALAGEKQRQDFICGFKLGMSRLGWADLWGEARERAKRRLLREYLDTEARFGRDISDLAPYVVTRSSRRPC